MDTACIAYEQTDENFANEHYEHKAMSELEHLCQKQKTDDLGWGQLISIME